MIEILATGALSTVQDQGRTAYRRFGVGTAGAMDRLALAIGNALVDNPPDAAGVEDGEQGRLLRLGHPVRLAGLGLHKCAQQLGVGALQSLKTNLVDRAQRLAVRDLRRAQCCEQFRRQAVACQRRRHLARRRHDDDPG